MCGRYARFTPAETYAQLFGARSGFTVNARYNVAPSDAVLAARNTPEGTRELVTLHWGLIPFWAKDKKIGYRTINARSETVASKPAFRHAFKRRRCLVAADGFYEWKRTNGPKQPFFIRMKDEQPFAFAGLWEHWSGDDETIDSCTIIVTDANDLLQDIHDRMPVILAPEDYDLWMDPDVQEAAALQPLLKPFRPDAMEAYPVGLAVNKPGNDSADLIQATSVKEH